jgi:hypothetical protein
MKLKLNDIQRAELKRACRDLGIRHTETDHTMREVRAAMVTRNNLSMVNEYQKTLRMLSDLILKHGDAQLSKRFCALVDWIAASVPLWGNHVYQEELQRLRTAFARTQKKAPYTSDQVRAVLAKLGPDAKRGNIASELGVDPKTFRRWGTDPDSGPASH